MPLLQLSSVGAVKIGMLALGIFVGTYWHEYFAGYQVAIAVGAAICLSYITYVWVTQRSDSPSPMAR